MENNKFIVSVVCSFLIIIFCFITYRDFIRVEKIKLDEFKISDEKFMCYIDKIEKKDNAYHITGWALKKGEDINTVECYVGLENDKKEIYKIKTKKEDRPDVTNALNDGNNYNMSGFLGVFPSNIMPKEEYNVVIIYKNNGNNVIIKTDKKISNRDDK